MKKYRRRSSSQVHRGNVVESLNDEISDDNTQKMKFPVKDFFSKCEEENYSTTCKICKTPSIKLMKKCGDWFQCDICEEYIWPKCYEKSDISADNDIFCNICIGSRILRSRSTRPEMFCKKGVLENVIKFKWKHLCQSLFFNKVAGPARCFPAGAFL